jgi:hypothetical protein
MKALTKYAIIAGTAAVLIGCGGSGDNGRPSPYAGAWSGTWSSSEAKDGGTLTLTITADGSVVGTMGRNGGLSGALSAVVENTGQYRGAVTFPTSGNFILRGAMSGSSAGLNSNFSYDWLGSTYVATFTASPPVVTTPASK